MKKIIMFILLIATVMLCLTSCVKEDVNIKINKNETGSISATVALKKDVYDNLSSIGSFSASNAEDAREVEYDGEKYMAVTKSIDYASLAELNKALENMTYSFDGFFDMPNETETTAAVIKTEATDPDIIFDNDDETDIEPAETENDANNNEPGFMDAKIFKSVEVKKDGSKFIFSAVVNKQDKYDTQYDLNNIMKISISLEMPGKITSYKNGTVDGKSIVFDITDIKEETELYAECKVTSIIPAIIGICLALGAIVVFIIIKKKSR